VAKKGVRNMVDIVGISSSSQTNRVSDRPSAKGSAAKVKSTSSPSSQSDRIDISAGKREADAVKRLVSLAQSGSDIRPEAVTQAKEKLANGEYEGIEVSRETAKRILGIM
jgi:anti-sigma28 factor (negative regulator of flagellin synthesis)